MADAVYGPINPNPAFTLLSNTQAAPSANLSGTYAMGATEGALLPSQPTYGYAANPTSPAQRQQYYQTQQGVLGATSQNVPNSPAPAPAPSSGGSGGSSSGGSSQNTGFKGIPQTEEQSYAMYGMPLSQWLAQNGNQYGLNQYGMTQQQIQNNQAAYDKAVQDLQGFVPILQQNAQNSQNAVQQSVQDTVNQAQTGEDTATNQANSAIDQQSAVLRSSLGGNNAYAASFGSGLSSFGQGLNNQTYQNFGNTIGGIQNNLQTGIQQFENMKNSAQKWGQQQIAGIGNSLQQGLQQIALNVDQTDIQKAQMVTQIQQQAAAQMNNINSIVAQLQANIEAARQNNLQTAAMYANVNPTLANNINSLADTFAAQGNRNVNSIFPGMPGMFGSNAYQKLYGSNIPNQNPFFSTTGQ